MEIIQKLQAKVGGRWHGVSFFNGEDEVPKDAEIRQTARFCEAVDLAVVHKFIVKPEQFTCPGASYAFGGMIDIKKTMIDKMVNQKGYSPAYAMRLLEQTPHLQKMPETLGFNCVEKPDILISQLQPEQVMRLVQMYHIKLKKPFRTEISSIISACGNVAVRAYEHQDMALSFGCDDSRAFGRLSRDRLYVGLAYPLAKDLTL